MFQTTNIVKVLVFFKKDMNEGRLIVWWGGCERGRSRLKAIENGEGICTGRQVVYQYIGNIRYHQYNTTVRHGRHYYLNVERPSQSIWNVVPAGR